MPTRSNRSSPDGSLRVPFARPTIPEVAVDAVLRVLASGQLTAGSEVQGFERIFATFTEAPHAVATSSCMGALHLSYLFLGLEPGDEVIVSAQTHAATGLAVELCGGRCVFVDSEPRTGNADLDQLEQLVTPRTRAISVVHFLGVPVDMRRVVDIARRHELYVVEDCALAPGALCDGVHVGLHGDAGVFSFYPAKHIATGEGGMLITRRPDLADSARRQRAFGVVRKDDVTWPGDYDVPTIGLNYRLNEMAAALGRIQTERLDGQLAVRRRNHEALAALLEDVEGVSVLGGENDRLQSAHYAFGMLLDETLGAKRPKLLAYLRSRGIGTSVYYPRPLPFLEYFRSQYGDPGEAYPVASAISARGICLPVGPHVGQSEVEWMADSVRAGIAGVR